MSKKNKVWRGPEAKKKSAFSVKEVDRSAAVEVKGNTKVTFISSPY